jgi:uncharacterized GH25 family protein
MRKHAWSVLLGTAALLCASTVLAHEIKVLASQYIIGPTERATVYLSWGHRIPVDDLIDASAIESFVRIAPDGTSTPLKTADVSLQANVVVLEEAGIHQVVVKRKPSIYTYILDDDGNRQMKRGPKSLHVGSKIDSASRSQQCAKALLVTGKAGHEAPKAIGHAIEIVPLTGPASWSKGAEIPFQVLLEGKPLANTDVTARYLGFRPETAWCYATSTENDGKFTILPQRSGVWVVKVNVKRPAAPADRAQFDTESFTATLSLEIP